MKLKVFLFLVVSFVTGYTTYNSVQTNTKLADLSLMNIESLAGEMMIIQAILVAVKQMEDGIFAIMVAQVLRRVQYSQE